MLKKIAFPLFSIFLVIQSYSIVQALSHSNPQTMLWWTTIVAAVLINLFITGVFAFAGFAYPTHRLLPAAYYNVKNAPLLHRIARMIGVQGFRKLLIALHYGKPKHRRQFFDGKRSGVSDLDYETRQAEFGHLGAFIIILVVCFYLLLLGHYLLVLLATVINVIANFYPIILQRTHRYRIQRLLNLKRSYYSKPTT